MNRKRAFAALALAALILLGLAAAAGHRSAQNQVHSRDIFAMDTIMSLTACGPHGGAAVDAAAAEILRLDALLSTGTASSEVSQINANGGGPVSEDTAALVRTALDVCASTDGAFDFTIYPLMRLWGFTTGEYHVPTAAELERVLPFVDASLVRFDGSTLTLSGGQQIDFGGVAKGYTSARIMEIFREYGVTSGMVSLGGNIQVLGKKPDGSPWRIGVQDPSASQGTPLAVVEVEDRAVVTSGGYERYFEQDGRTYIHILDPRTGYPAEPGLLSVTVISEDGTLADALSTALYVMGLEGAVSYWQESGGTFDMALLTTEGEIFVTAGISGSFSSSVPVSVLERSTS